MPSTQRRCADDPDPAARDDRRRSSGMGFQLRGQLGALQARNNNSRASATFCPTPDNGLLVWNGPRSISCGSLVYDKVSAQGVGYQVGGSCSAPLNSVVAPMLSLPDGSGYLGQPVTIEGKNGPIALYGNQFLVPLDMVDRICRSGRETYAMTGPLGFTQRRPLFLI